MEPSNDRELRIARIADQISMEGTLDLSTISEVVVAVDFIMSVTDSAFLVNYVRWRADNPLAKTRFSSTEIRHSSVQRTLRRYLKKLGPRLGFAVSEVTESGSFNGDDEDQVEGLRYS